MKSFLLLASVLLCAAPGFASVTIVTPVSGATVSKTFSLQASASPCSNQAISAMGYALDSGATLVVKGASLSASVTASTGSHVLHLKSWGTQGAFCNAAASVTVSGDQNTTTDVKVSAPGTGATVGSPFAVTASGTVCSGQAITSAGYSLDSSSTSTSVSGGAISARVFATGGSHTLHVKWSGAGGASCKSDVAVVVKGPAVPSTATATNLIQSLSTWIAAHDSGTHGTSTGSTGVVANPSWTGAARRFVTSYTDYGGERYTVSLPGNASATHFVFDAMLYLANPSTDVSNLEMDVNQVTANGDTVIYGFQCDNWSHTWDYTENAGTPAKRVDHWLHSNQACYLQKWATNTWHHVQICYSRDDFGNVTYGSVWLDGVEQDLNVTVPSAFSLGWDANLSSNLQIGGANSTSGSSTIYLDHLTIYSW